MSKNKNRKKSTNPAAIKRAQNKAMREAVNDAIYQASDFVPLDAVMDVNRLCPAGADKSGINMLAVGRTPSALAVLLRAKTEKEMAQYMDNIPVLAFAKEISMDDRSWAAASYGVAVAAYVNYVELKTAATQEEKDIALSVAYMSLMSSSYRRALAPTKAVITAIIDGTAAAAA